ncbi:DUF2017 family protein [Actinokineospora alba]|uniref:DUF2017 family protein n=1 Tax=Actinokineospora alba TaxID=504798 RepID=UPI00105F5957|nr:DUF2017 family protein [Actinokineospora alba]
MIGWDRCGDTIIGILSPRQIRWLRKHLTDYRHRVDRGLSGCYDDPVLMAVFANNAEGNLDLRLHRARQSITVLLDALPARGGVIEVYGDMSRMTWVWTLQDLRVAVAARLAGLSNTSASTAGVDAQAKLQTWLSGIVESLVNAGEMPLIPNGPNNGSQSWQ